ncbi:MAG: ferric reductase-like transmembrane domain-containing protein [Candidatus Paceibacterota bacterium]|jgi:predicted ferric reductase
MKFFKNHLNLILIVILLILPLIFWSFMRPFSDRFMSLKDIFRSLGQITGLLGMTLLSFNFVLAARFKFLDKLFNGLNRVYIKHHTFGATAFCLLLFHPTFLIIQYLFVSLRTSFDFIFSFQDWSIILGEVSLLFFIVLMVITFYLNFKYQNWKNTHQYLGIVLFLGSLHMLFISSDVSNSVVLKYYMLALVILGACSYFYRTILKFYKKREFRYKLKEVKKINRNIVELKLLPLGEKIKFLPGQFVFLRFENEGILSESHPFSITSSSNSEELYLGIKALGDYTSMVYLLEPGVICKIEGPFGAFSYLKAKSKKQIWVAGGIGITPFLSMARQVNKNIVNNDYQIDLYYSVSNPTEVVFMDEFTQISMENNNFKFYPYFSEKNNHISADFIYKKSENMQNTEIFICGPSKLMKNLKKQFINLGINSNKIHSEEFNL